MIVETISHLMILDLGWFVSLIFNNLFWVFTFFSTASILDESKTTLGSIGLFLFFVVDIFTELSFSALTGLVFAGAGFLALCYITRTALTIVTESVPSLRKHLIKIVILHWALVYWGYNLFLR